MVGGGLGKQTAKKHGLAPQTTKAVRSAMPAMSTANNRFSGLPHQTANDWRFGVANHHFPKKEWWSGPWQTSNL